MPYLHTLPRWLRMLMPDGVYDIPAGDERVVYLTFDDGPTPEVTDWVLDTLAEYRALATFFLIGKNVVAHPEIYHRIWSEGHSIGNHTYHHLNASKTPFEDYMRDITMAQRLIPSKLFRPPYGRINKKIAKALTAEQMTLVMWSILSGDFDYNLSAESSLEIVKNAVRPGSVIVYHDSVKAKKTLYHSLPLLLDFLREEGYTCRAISMK